MWHTRENVVWTSESAWGCVSTGRSCTGGSSTTRAVATARRSDTRRSAACVSRNGRTKTTIRGSSAEETAVVADPEGYQSPSPARRHRSAEDCSRRRPHDSRPRDTAVRGGWLSVAVRVVRCAGLGAASCAPPAEGHRHTLVVPLEPRAASGCSRRRVPSRDSADGDEAQRSPRVCEYTPGREALCWHATPTGTRDCAETRYAPVSTTGCARLRQCVHPEQIPGRTLTVRRAPPPVCGRQLAATCGTPSIAASTTEPVRPAPVTHGRYVLCDPATTAGTHDRMSTLRPRDYRWHSRSYEQVRRPLRRRRTG